MHLRSSGYVAPARRHRAISMPSVIRVANDSDGEAPVIASTICCVECHWVTFQHLISDLSLCPLVDVL